MLQGLVQVLHLGLTKFVSGLVGRAVQPTYCYLVQYIDRATLPQHTDREQCQYSLSMLLKYDPSGKEAAWPMFLLVNGSERALTWEPGSALAYRGMQVPHRRAPLPERHTSINAFFHYTAVDTDVKNHGN